MAPQRELDLRALILLAWSMRVPLLLAFVVVTVGYGGYWLAARDVSETATFSRVVQFTFDGVENGRYPNGAPFHIGDLVTPDLIAALYEMHGLGERGVVREAFANAFAIEPYSPEYGHILSRGEQLADRGTPAELVVLQEQLTAELRRAGQGAARLSFRPLSPLPLAEGDVGKLLLDLPKLWATQAVETYGVFGPDVPVYSPAQFDVEEAESAEYVVALEAIRRKASAFGESIHAAMDLPHANNVRDRATGASLLDVRETVRALLAEDVQRLWADIVQLGIAKDRGALIREYEYRVGELARAAEVAADRMTTLERTLATIGRAPAAPQPAVEQGVAPLANEPLPSGALATALLSAEREAARLALELGTKRTALDAFKRRGPGENEPSDVRIETRLAQVVTVLHEQATVAQRIHGLLSRDNFAADGGLYRIADGGLMVSRPPAWRPRDLYVYVLLLFAAVTAVLIVGNAVRGREHH